MANDDSHWAKTFARIAAVLEVAKGAALTDKRLRACMRTIADYAADALAYDPEPDQKT